MNGSIGRHFGHSGTQVQAANLREFVGEFRRWLSGHYGCPLDCSTNRSPTLCPTVGLHIECAAPLGNPATYTAVPPAHRLLKGYPSVAIRDGRKGSLSRAAPTVRSPRRREPWASPSGNPKTRNLLHRRSSRRSSLRWPGPRTACSNVAVFRWSGRMALYCLVRTIVPCETLTPLSELSSTVICLPATQYGATAGEVLR